MGRPYRASGVNHRGKRWVAQDGRPVARAKAELRERQTFNACAASATLPQP
jgi:hypothetical protein